MECLTFVEMKSVILTRKVCRFDRKAQSLLDNCKLVRDGNQTRRFFYMEQSCNNEKLTYSWSAVTQGFFHPTFVRTSLFIPRLCYIIEAWAHVVLRASRISTKFYKQIISGKLLNKFCQNLSCIRIACALASSISIFEIWRSNGLQLSSILEYKKRRPCFEYPNTETPHKQRPISIFYCLLFIFFTTLFYLLMSNFNTTYILCTFYCIFVKYGEKFSFF